MKTLYILLLNILMIVPFTWSNNVQVSNVRLTNQNTTDDFTMVEFDITWENSWRYSGGPNNWDAAWIFVKYKIGPGPWLHAWLNNAGHQTCGSTTIENGLLTPGAAFNSTTNPVLGVFLYRAVQGSGTFSCQDVQLRWNYGANGVADNAQVDIKVFAIEMVYIPQGSFYVGSGGTEPGAFYTYPNSNTPYFIASESAITVGSSADYLYYNSLPGGASGDQLGPIPAEYPKGFAAFYAMKYEISQKGYVDFLNTLKREQQVNCVNANIYGTNPGNVWVMSGGTNPAVARNGIRCRNPIPPSPAPVEFFCDFNNNSIANETGDGLGIPSNYMHYDKLASYLDWACLRFFSEFEFEKCGRGIINPKPNEYAWGTQVIYLNAGILNSGLPTEIPSENFVNAANNSYPLRNGAFARIDANRELVGAGYYGCMELSGNILEVSITVGSPQGRAYTGVHGNGLLNAIGINDVLNWPLAPYGTSGTAHRGGYGDSNIELERLSNREMAFDVYDTGLQLNGGRGARAAQ